MCEFPAVYHMKPRRARKEHRCCECRGKILKGESYNYHSGVWDSQGRSFKVCVDCDLLRDFMNKGRDIEDRAPFGGLVDDILAVGDPATDRRMVEIMKKREAKIPEEFHPAIIDGSVWRSRGKLWFKCKSCGQDTEMPVGLDEIGFEGLFENWCGRSEHCCP